MCKAWRRLTDGPRLLCAGHGIVKGARTLLGETNPVNSAPGTIRGDLSCDIGRWVPRRTSFKFDT